MQLPRVSRTRVIVVVLVVLGAFIIYRRTHRPASYTPYTVTSRDLTDSLELSGKTTASSTATLRFLTGGYVTYLGAKEGDSVKKWQILASLDTRQLQNLLTQKLNLYAIERGTFDQTIDDNDNSVPGGDLARELSRLLAKNQYQLDNTVLDVEYQDLSLKLSRLVSPLAGILIHSPASAAPVQVTSADTWVVVDPTSLEFVADVDETDLSRVKVGQKVTLTLDSAPDRPIATVITSIAFSPKETTTGTTFAVHMSIPKEDMASLRLGLNGTAKVELASKQGVPTLPQSAITYLPEGAVVYHLEGNKYTTEPITPGIEDEGYVELQQGPGVGAVVYAKSQD